MAMKKKTGINPVFDHKKSIALVDTAEDLVDSLDNLSICLKHIEEKHVQNRDATQESEGEASLYGKLKENLEIARDLTDTLMREKWRLSRRKMSVELRMGELEDYKSHLKRDMTDMNQTMESLSMRIIQLEDTLVEAQELQEQTEAERNINKQCLQESQAIITDLEAKQTKLIEDVRQLKLQRKDSVLKMHHQELSDRIEILMLENKSLKDIIREKEETDEQQNDNVNTNSMSDINENKTAEYSSSNVSAADSGTDHIEPRSQRLPVLTETTEIAYV